MTKILQLTFALLLIGNVGFAQQKEQDSNDSSDIKPEECTRLRNVISSATLTASQCNSLLTALGQYDIPGPGIGSRTSVTPMGKSVPVTSGKGNGSNITVYKSKTNDKIYFELLTVSGGKITRGKAYDLGTYTVEVKFEKNNEFTVEVLEKTENSGNYIDNWDKYPLTIPSVKYNLDCKLVPNFQETKAPAFVGINDARGYQAGKGIAAPLDVLPFPNEKRVRITQKGNELLVGASSSVKKVYDNDMDPKKVGQVCWGIDLDTPMSKCQ